MATTQPKEKGEPLLGRFEILGELATGGMAEILLARIVGPSGFERPVVVKRILPHLAKQKSFVSMFVDEARIAAGIRHPNVVHVQELSVDDGELFLVMEYLEGETVSGLMKRMLARGDHLSPTLAAFIVAEACAGLHAAHELRDEQGTLRGVVHRDVSPQNVFVTYDGHVKLLDFGVATAVDRNTRTETGQIKGKFAYMSPEQWRNAPLDRRSDIFAMGTVLYELSTGRRLFARDSPPAVMAAICEEPVIPPSRLVSDYPEALEAICLKALSTERDSRHATAADLRRELLELVRASGDLAADPSTALATLMRATFAERIEEKRALLSAVREAAPVRNIPAGEVDDDVELPSVVVDGVTGTALRPLGAATDAAAPPRRARRWPMLVLAIASAGAAAWIARTVSRAPAHDTADRSAVAPANTSTTSAASAMPTRGDLAAPDSAPTSVILPSPAPPTTAPAARVTLRIESRPSGAFVQLAHRDAGVTPAELQVEPTTERQELVLFRKGYRRLEQTVTVDRDQRLLLTLEREAAPRGAGTARAPVPSSSSPRARFDRFE